MATKAVTDATFAEDVLKSDKPVLVDFWAQWCGPCKMIAPSLEEIAGERQDIVIAKMDIDSNPMSPTQYGVRSIPTMILFKDGKPYATKIGALPKSALVNWINQSLA